MIKTHHGIGTIIIVALVLCILVPPLIPMTLFVAFWCLVLFFLYKLITGTPLDVNITTRGCNCDWSKGQTCPVCKPLLPKT